MGDRVRYASSDCFENYPFPLQDALRNVNGIASRYYDHRQSLLRLEIIGLTDLYNRLHDSQNSTDDIQKLRDLHVEMDQAVAAAYGWDDLDLGHGFHTTKQGERFTISEAARREVLQRLLKLNHDRYAEEVKQGLHDKKGKAKKTDTPKRRKKSAANGPGLFGDDDDEGG
jgi:hypothetical protein